MSDNSDKKEVQPEVKNAYTPPTDEQIAEWEKNHGEIYRIEVAAEVVKYDPYLVPSEEEEPLQGEVMVGYIKKPSDKTLSYAFTRMPQMLEAGKIILKTSWLGGDPRILNEQDSFTSAALQCIEFLQIKQSKLKKHSTTGTK